MSQDTKRDLWVILILVLIACIVSPWLIKNISFSVCGFHKLTGWPCPFCGGTRSLAALGKLKFREAFSLNPLAAFTCLAALILLPAQIFSENIRNRLKQWPLGKIFLILLLFNWLYLILAYKF